MAFLIAQSYFHFLKLNFLKILKDLKNSIYQYLYNFNILIIVKIVIFSREIIVIVSNITIHYNIS